MSDLWQPRRDEALRGVEPLAVRMRPRTLDEFAGQRHLLGPRAGEVSDGGSGGAGGDESARGTPLLRRMIDSGSMTSIILHGPPGTGKTTLASLIAGHTGRVLVRENAANVSVKRVREIVEEAVNRLATAGGSNSRGAWRTLLLLDEIHRFSKAQQDVLLDDVERGRITLIGVTTENPLFAVNAALVSRSTIFRLEPLNEQDVAWLVRRAIADPERGYGKVNLRVTDEAIAHWARMCEGDARRALTALEVAYLSTRPATPDSRLPTPDSRSSTPDSPPITIDLAIAEQSVQHKAIVYDHTGDGHYDHASALIKSVRGSDPDAAVYWLAVMLEAGEDPRFIARRLAILASEDIGNADPRAIMVAAAAWELCERLGMPECRITLSQCAIYLALAPKSNASYLAINAAMEDVRGGRTVPVPLHLRDPNKARSAGSAVEGKGYQYAHDSGTRTSIGGVTTQEYLGVDRTYYDPAGVGAEKVLKERLEEVKRARKGQA